MVGTSVVCLLAWEAVRQLEQNIQGTTQKMRCVVEKKGQRERVDLKARAGQSPGVYPCRSGVCFLVVSPCGPGWQDLDCLRCPETCT